MRSSLARTGILPVLALLLAATPSRADLVGAVVKWTGAGGGLPTSLSTFDGYSGGLEPIGDLDGDGITDVAAGLSGTTGTEGKLWIQFLNPDGTVRAITEIAEGAGGFVGPTAAYDRFGRAIANLGDLDGDGVTDLAVSAHGDDFSGFGRGAVYVLFLNADGTVKAEQKISDVDGGFTATLDDGDFFGLGLAAVGDLDGDGVQDLLASAPYDDDGGSDRGAVYVLFLKSDGTVKSFAKLSSTTPGFGGVLSNGDSFGVDALQALGDLDGDGLLEVAVGAANDDDGGTDRGAVYLLELQPTGALGDLRKLSATAGDLDVDFKNSEHFGGGLELLPDLDGDGLPELLVGAYGHGEGPSNTDEGSLWVVYLNADGTASGEELVAHDVNGFGPLLTSGDFFGVDLAVIDDLDGNGVPEVVVGAAGDDDDGLDAGGAYVLSLQPCSTAATATLRNAGTNPMSYSALPPQLGRTWIGAVDLTTTGHALAVVVGFDSPFQLTLGGGQTLLAIDGGSGELLGLSLLGGPIAVFRQEVPPESVFCGFTLSTQALHIGGVTPFALSNAQDLVVGR